MFYCVLSEVFEKKVSNSFFLNPIPFLGLPYIQYWRKWVNFCPTFGRLIAISIREAQPNFIDNDLPLFQEEYLSLHPRGVIPVQVNDVFFTIHAVFITAVTICQCFIYEVLAFCLKKKLDYNMNMNMKFSSPSTIILDQSEFWKTEILM